jgi:hypothetical protein
LKPLLRYVWAAPCTAVGLILGVALLGVGARWHLHRGVIEIARSNAHLTQRPRFVRRYAFKAITLGHVVIASRTSDLTRLRAHERVHVRQYEVWGFLFFVAYPLASLWQGIRGRRPYLDNPFEVQARVPD